MTDPLVADLTPVLKVDGEAVGQLARDQVRLEVEEGTEGLKRMSAHFLAVGPRSGAPNETLLYLDGAILDFGKAIQVVMGPPGGERIVFDGLVSGLEVSFIEDDLPDLKVFAEDQLMKLRMTRRLKTYENITDADIARSIADAHGISADVAADGPTYDVVQQWNQSDLAFLRERARLVQAEIWFQDGSLKFMTRPNRPGTSLTLVQGNDIVLVRIRADLAHQRSSMAFGGYEAQGRETIDEKSQGDVVQAETSGGRTGPEVLGLAMGERISYRVREVPLTSEEAGAWARAEMLRRARCFVEVSGITKGTPDMMVGSKLNLQRVGQPFEGDGYYVTRVRHTFDKDNGFRTSFEAERATVNAGAA